MRNTNITTSSLLSFTKGGVEHVNNQIDKIINLLPELLPACAEQSRSKRSRRASRRTTLNFSLFTLNCILLCFLFGSNAWSQSLRTLTVHDNNTTSRLVPMYVYYFDQFSRSQVVIPAGDLAEMAGGTISSITFYTSTNTTYTTASSFDLYLTEVDYTSISGYENEKYMAKIFSGTKSFESDHITFNLSVPYYYGGGDLLIACKNTTNSGYSSIYFYGENVNGASISGYNGSSSNDAPANQQNFIPKTTFTYTPPCKHRVLSFGSSTPTSVTKGSTITCTASASAAGGTITYTSSDPDIASVNSSGVVTGNELGTAVITATIGASGDYCGGASASIFISVGPAAPNSNNVTQSAGYCGDNITLTAPTGSVPSGYTYHWYSNSDCTTSISGAFGTYNSQISVSSSVYTNVYCRLEKIVSLQETTDFTYTGDVHAYKVPAGTTSLQLEVWGAQGGRAKKNNTNGAKGGKGGYTKGTYTPAPNSTLYVCVGGKGSDAVLSSCVNFVNITAHGGYNGGGGGTCDEESESSINREASGAGGGATHIAKAAPSSGNDYQLRYYSSNQSDILLVAGGGGGSSFDSTGGTGGGAAGGAGANRGRTYSGGFGFGANGHGIGDGDGVAGGGGGWTGGNAYCLSEGSDVASQAAGGTAYTGGVSGGTTTGGQQSGDGKAKIVATINHTIAGGIAQIAINCHLCPTPTITSVTNITTSGATLSWESSEGSQWQYACVLHGVSPSSWTTTTNSSVTLSSLAISTKYDFYVRTLCSGSSNSVATMIPFQTLCSSGLIEVTEDTPWTEGFEDDNTSLIHGHCEQLNTCFFATPLESYQPREADYGYCMSPFVYADYIYAAHSGIGSVELKTNNTKDIMLVLPQFTNELRSLAFEFYANTENTGEEGKMQIGYVTDANDASTFHLLYDNQKSVTGRGAGNGKLMGPYYFTEVHNNTSRIAIKFIAYGSNVRSTNIDDFRVYLLPMYRAEWIAEGTVIDDSDWCTGETRTVTLKVKNTGWATWIPEAQGGNIARSNEELAANPDGVVAVSYKWDEDPWYDSHPGYTRVNFTDIVEPNQIGTVTFPVDKPRRSGANTLTFNIIRSEQGGWFSLKGYGPVKQVPINVTAPNIAVSNANNLANCLDGATQVILTAGAGDEEFRFEDNFNDGIGNWDVTCSVHNDYKWSKRQGTNYQGYTSAHNGSGYNAGVAYSNSNSTASYSYLKLNTDLSSYSEMKLSFFYMNPYYSSSHTDDYDYFYVERYTEGSGWAQVSAYNTIYHNSWTQVTDLTIPDGTKYIRFSAYMRGSDWGAGCAVDDVVLTGKTSPTYTWSCTAGSTPGSADVNTYRVTPSALHNTYTVSSGGCSSSISFDVPKNATLSITSSSPTIDCGEQVTLTASGLDGAIYNWYDSESALVQGNSTTFAPTLTTATSTHYTYTMNATVQNLYKTIVYDAPGSYSLDLPRGVSSVIIEAWGAQGGGYLDCNGGKGGYSKGRYSVSSPQTLYICVGGAGEVGTDQDYVSGGYNGGGRARTGSSWIGCSGGGCSHVATRAGTLKEIGEGNKSQVLVVAGGGGGGRTLIKRDGTLITGSSNGTVHDGGYGGGDTGGTGGGGVTGGSQSAKGTSVKDADEAVITEAGFGYGGAAKNGYQMNGGGGGLYGGGCGRLNAGAGGSGYVKDGLADVVKKAGNQEMPSPYGGTMTGKTGNGYVRIMLFGTQSCTSDDEPVTVTVNSPQVSLDVITNKTICNGESVSLEASASSTNTTPNKTFDYSWSPSDGLSDTNVASVTANPTTTKDYTYAVTVTLNSNDACTASIYKEMIVNVDAPNDMDNPNEYQFIWKGGTAGHATDWNTPSNWYMNDNGTYSVASGTSLPTTSSNIYIGTANCVTADSWPSQLSGNAEASVKDITIASGATLTIPNRTLKVAGKIVNNGTFDAPVVFAGNNTTLSSSESASTTFRSVTINSGSKFTSGDRAITLTGNWTNNSAVENSYTAGTGKIIFAGNGESAQTIGGDYRTTFNNVEIHTNEKGLSINTEPIISGTATFTSGIVTGPVTFSATATSPTASLASHIDGLVSKTGNNGNPFTFPTGNDGVLGTVQAKVPNDKTVKVQFYHKSDDGNDHAEGFSLNDMPRWWNVADMYSGNNPQFNHVSNFEFWRVHNTTDGLEATLTVSAESASEHFGSLNPSPSADQIYGAFWDAGIGKWKNISKVEEGDVQHGSIENNRTISAVVTIPVSSLPTRAVSGNYITYGSTDHNTLLPIELLSFTADCDGRSSLIEWTTATEKNNEYFMLERSDDAINFTEITRMPSVAEGGNSIEPLDYSYTDYGVHGGDNYYRLWQVDYDGTRTASEIIVANCVEPEVGEPDVQAYPNPFSGELTLVLDNFENRPATIEVYDMLGKLIFTQKADSPQNQYQTVLNLSNLPPAAYTIRVSTNDFVINKNVIKN